MPDGSRQGHLLPAVCWPSSTRATIGANQSYVLALHRFAGMEPRVLYPVLPAATAPGAVASGHRAGTTIAGV